jgi:hypothetical protein
LVEGIHKFRIGNKAMFARANYAHHQQAAFLAKLACYFHSRHT